MKIEQVLIGYYFRYIINIYFKHSKGSFIQDVCNQKGRGREVSKFHQKLRTYMQDDLHLGERGVSKIGKNCVWLFLYHYFCTQYKCMIKLIHLTVRNITFKIIHRSTGIGKPYRAYHNLTANQVISFLPFINFRKERNEAVGLPRKILFRHP